MPYRKLTLNGQTYTTRLSVPALMEWVGTRSDAQGYPARPPDIDTPLLRGWLSHPGEREDDPHFMERDRAKSQAGMVYAVTGIPLPLTKDAPDILKLIVTCDGDTYTYEMKGLYLRGQSDDFAVSATAQHEDADDALRSTLHGFSMLVQPETIMVVTSSDMDALEDELDQAEKDIDDYFGVDKTRKLVH